MPCCRWPVCFASRDLGWTACRCRVWGGHWALGTVLMQLHARAAAAPCSSVCVKVPRHSDVRTVGWVWAGGGQERERERGEGGTARKRMHGKMVGSVTTSRMELREKTQVPVLWARRHFPFLPFWGWQDGREGGWLLLVRYIVRKQRWNDEPSHVPWAVMCACTQMHHTPEMCGRCSLLQSGGLS